MATEKQVAANRLNAAKSTGLRSDDGKARSSLNAVVHGLTAESVCLLNENPESLRAFAEELRARYQPRGVLQEEIVDRIVLHTWRLDRARRAERALFVFIHSRAVRATEEGTLPPTVEIMICNEMKDRSKLLQLQGYEQRIERALNSAIIQFIKVRKLDREIDDARSDGEKAIGKTHPVARNEEKGAHDFRESDIATDPRLAGELACRSDPVERREEAERPTEANLRNEANLDVSNAMNHAISVIMARAKTSRESVGETNPISGQPLATASLTVGGDEASRPVAGAGQRITALAK